MAHDPGKPGTQAPIKKAMDYAAVRDWPGYYRAVAGKQARETLLAALAAFDAEPAREPREAVDLGCGEGRDTAELLRRGWRVLAIDAEPVAFDHLLRRVPAEHRPRLLTRVCTLEDADWPEADLVNASYTLPFVSPARFDAVWRRIVRAVRPGGRFAGQLFGERDDWATLPDRTHHARSALDTLLDAFVLESLREEEKDEPDALGNPKHWHVFHVVARKR